MGFRTLDSSFTSLWVDEIKWTFGCSQLALNARYAHNVPTYHVFIGIKSYVFLGDLGNLIPIEVGLLEISPPRQ